MVKIVRAIQTAIACPSQWDAWDDEDNYYYLRFRHGCGEMRQYKDENWVDAPWKENIDRTQQGWLVTANTAYIRTVATFEHEDEWAGMITLEEFAARAGFELADNLYSTGYGDHLRDELIKKGVTGLLNDTGDPIADEDENTEGSAEGTQI